MTDPFKDGIKEERANGHGRIILHRGQVEALYNSFEARFLEKYPVHPRETQEERAEWFKQMVMEGKK